MKRFQSHPWQVIENGFDPELNEVSESKFSIGNGHMGLRGNFEESFSGSTLQGSYLAGIFHQEKSNTFSWKKGFPECSAALLNSPSWIGIDVQVVGEVLDLATCKVKSFKRVLNMKEGYLERSFTAKLLSGKEVKVKVIRFCSLKRKTVGVIRYSITPMNFEGPIKIIPFLDGDVANQNTGQEKSYWKEEVKFLKKRSGYLLTETQNGANRVCVGMKFRILKNNEPIEFLTEPKEEENYVGCMAEVFCRRNEEVEVQKFSAVISSFSHPKANLFERCQELTRKAFKRGFEKLFKKHAAAWAANWSKVDIEIEGDVAAQQAIRYNIFQLFQAYTGTDERLNIGPKGFTGERYGGTTRWDTEASCIPFFLATSGHEVARNLLIYRYKHLKKAIENAERVGFSNGAALFPTATVTGTECHGEWEVNLEGIHRNGAIAYAIFDYVRYTSDKKFLLDYGLEILIGIARFWAQRVHWSIPKQKYVIHGVVGPNEYELNVNNNWHTNYVAAWCLRFAAEAVASAKRLNTAQTIKLMQRTNFDEAKETQLWVEIASKMYFPKDKKLEIFLQQDGFLDKVQLSVTDLKPEERPLFQNWSWDRILRSVFIQRADVLQGMYLFEDDFDEATLRRNFEYYEPRTVHESSHSPSIHAILASRLGKRGKAYDLFMRSARLDLDNLQKDTQHGLHVTSMAGTWLAFIKGFAGMRVEQKMLSFRPYLPNGWTRYAFKIHWRKNVLQLTMTKSGPVVLNLKGEKLQVKLNGKMVQLKGEQRQRES